MNLDDLKNLNFEEIYKKAFVQERTKSGNKLDIDKEVEELLYNNQTENDYNKYALLFVLTSKIGETHLVMHTRPNNRGFVKP